MRRAAIALGAIMVALSLSLSACGSTPTATDEAPAKPGSVVGEPIPRNYPGLAAKSSQQLRFQYRSTYGPDNSLTTVSGAVFVPQGSPPPGGWPIAAIAHPTTGISSTCGPSLYPNLLGADDMVMPPLESGFVTVVTDYQGLGTAGPHPYMEPTTAAYNVIDSVRAARELVPTASKKWIGFGISQGAQAVIRADEVSKRYGAGLDLRGVVAMSPVWDLRPLVDAMVGGDVTPAQRELIPSLLVGLGRVHPQLTLSDYLHGSMGRAVDVFTSCSDDRMAQKARILAQSGPADVRPVDDNAARRLREWLGESALPQGNATSPMLVAYSSADRVISPKWTADAIEKACRMNYSISAVTVANQQHGILDIGSVATQWLVDRMAGKPQKNTCT